MKRIVIEQGLPLTAAPKLRARGWDAVHVSELSMHDAADRDILSFGTAQQRVVITLDSDFPQILALTAATAPSVVLIRMQRIRATELADLLMFTPQPELVAAEMKRVCRPGCRRRF
ncbi:MAG: hypothetical protein FJW38_12435 [Acidobacteria bacterium]|nr:hypothetical protein [Acidobacteriota bacterium]